MMRHLPHVRVPHRLLALDLASPGVPVQPGTGHQEAVMSTISRDTAPNVDDPGPVEVRSGELAGYTVDFMTVRQGHDMAPLLVGLPDDHCPCPHWGYVLK